MKTLWAMSKPVRWRLWIKVAAGIIRIGTSLGFVAASKHLVDIATKVSDSSMSQGIAIFIGILILQLALTIFTNWWDAWCKVKSQNTLRKELFGHVLSSRWSGRERFLIP